MATDPRPSAESAQQAGEERERRYPSVPDDVVQAWHAKTDEVRAHFEARAAEQRKSSTPAGKVKASFNLLPEDLAVLRVLAERLGTTVTNVLERAIRDEHFVQEQLAAGHRFAIVNRDGTVREIIWR
jgi:hypothetical protein